MIFPGDRILVGLSGGKDSLATAFALAQRRGKGGVQYELAALMVDWEEFPAPADAVERLAEWLKTLSIPFIHKKLKFADISHTETFSCYACSRARRRLLFEEAMKRGFGTVALGHTLDDFAATALMNLCFRGRLEPLMPRRDFFGGKLRVIRPLCEIREGTISTLAERLGFPVFKVECPNAESTLRDRLRPIVAQLLKIDTLVRENCYRAWFGPGLGKTGTDEAQYGEG
jgi:tRNA 2-thiocytidine biosynthesis protein TtcA